MPDNTDLPEDVRTAVNASLQPYQEAGWTFDFRPETDPQRVAISAYGPQGQHYLGIFDSKATKLQLAERIPLWLPNP